MKQQRGKEGKKGAHESTSSKVGASRLRDTARANSRSYSVSAIGISSSITKIYQNEKKAKEE